MNLPNYADYGCFDYVSAKIETPIKLGDVVINKENSVGIIIQIHEDGDYRTDAFGNCSLSEIRLATNGEIKEFRPNIEIIPLFSKNYAITDRKRILLNNLCINAYMPNLTPAQSFSLMQRINKATTIRQIDTLLERARKIIRKYKE